MNQNPFSLRGVVACLCSGVWVPVQRPQPDHVGSNGQNDGGRWTLSRRSGVEVKTSSEEPGTGRLLDKTKPKMTDPHVLCNPYLICSIFIYSMQRDAPTSPTSKVEPPAGGAGGGRLTTRAACLCRVSAWRGSGRRSAAAGVELVTSHPVADLQQEVKKFPHRPALLKTCFWLGVGIGCLGRGVWGPGTHTPPPHPLHPLL